MITRRVLILYTGGTFGMDLVKKTESASPWLAIPHLNSRSLGRRFQRYVPELQNIADCHFKLLLNRDSAHIGPPEWIQIASEIRTHWKSYDGIVVLHGTDTLAYTASALSFLLRPCLKPVVVTGAQLPLSVLRTDARSNLISAVEIAAHGPRKLLSQVTVFFGDKLFQGNRVRKRSAADFAAFESPTRFPLAVVGTTIRYAESTLCPKFARIPLAPSFSDRVMVAHVTPAFPSLAITQSLLTSLHGLVLVVFHSGTAPTHNPKFIQFLQAIHRLKIPLTLVTEGSTQPPGGHESPQFRYEAGSELLKTGCFLAGSMTPECAFVKTALLLGQSLDLKSFSHLWKGDLAGERM